jgi:hypothetical protein
MHAAVQNAKYEEPSISPSEEDDGSPTADP